METGLSTKAEGLNLSGFRLDERSDWVDRYIDSLGLSGFQDYRQKTYSALESLKKGHYYDVLAIEENKQELFIKFCCEYIRYYDGDIYMSDNYTQVWRNKL